MASMNRMERVRAVVAGEPPDRPPVSFWHHFPPEACHGRAAIDAHLRHLARYDLDFLKTMNDNGYPTRRDVRAAADLRDLPVLTGTETPFARQLELIGALAGELKGRVPLATTLFNAWAVLRRIVTPKLDQKHGPPTLGGPVSSTDRSLGELLQEDRTVITAALESIAASLANFARRCIEAGADGIFLSVRDDWVVAEGRRQEAGGGSRTGASADDRVAEAQSQDTYHDLVRPGDLRILAAAADGDFNVLHVCGIPQNLDAFGEYPVAVINWADRAAGPRISDVINRLRPAVCGGVDNLATLPQGTPEEVRAEVADALRQAGSRPIMISPGCTYDPDAVPPANLDTLTAAARAV